MSVQPLRFAVMALLVATAAAVDRLEVEVPDPSAAAKDKPQSAFDTACSLCCPTGVCIYCPICPPPGTQTYACHIIACAGGDTISCSCSGTPNCTSPATSGNEETAEPTPAPAAIAPIPSRRPRHAVRVAEQAVGPSERARDAARHVANRPNRQRVRGSSTRARAPRHPVLVQRMASARTPQGHAGDGSYNSTWGGLYSPSGSGHWEATVGSIPECQALFTWMANVHLVVCEADGAPGSALYLSVSGNILNVSLETSSATYNYTCSGNGLSAPVTITNVIIDDFDHGVYEPWPDAIAASVAAMCDLLTPATAVTSATPPAFLAS